MIRFRESKQHEAITKAISSVLTEYTLNLVRADWKYYHNELWTNVKYFMDNSLYGIAVFEQIHDQDTNPNVSFELGYMIAQEKKCLILKEKHVPMLQSDLLGNLYREFDSYNIERTVRAAVVNWLKDIGIAKKSDERLLVFVSGGGTCRCAMAKVITQQLLQHNPLDYKLRVESMARGHPFYSHASNGAQRAIQEIYGVNFLVNHRPTGLTSAIIDEADLILVMDRSLLKGLPSDKTHVLKEYFGLQGDVVDPWPDTDAGSDLRYAKCAFELKEVMEKNIGMMIDALRPKKL
jgi:protein-tyrosine-phosphatase